MVKKLLILFGPGLLVVAFCAIANWSYLSSKDKAYSDAIASLEAEPSTKQIAQEAYNWTHHIPDGHTEEFNKIDREQKAREAFERSQQ